MSNNNIDFLLKQVGATPEQRQRFAAAMSANKNKDNGGEIKLPRASEIHETLRKNLPELSAESRGAIVRVLARAGHIADDMDTELHASTEALRPIQREALAHCRRLGIPVHRGNVDRHELDRVLAGQSIEQRVGIKTLLASAGYLD
jgi:hypothetical protein